MRIIIDAFGGDNAPIEVLKGACSAIEKYKINITLTGIAKDILKCAEENNIDISKMKIEEASQIITMEDEPTLAVREKKDSSMMRGLALLSSGEGDAFVTAGSTGAALAGATFIVKRIKGVKRAALSPLLPAEKGPYMLIDCGANVDPSAQYLYQFGVMGSVYMEKVMGIEKPKVGLINIGTEETKGGKLQIDTYELLKNSPLNFVGNVEPRDLPFNVCDVAVCDGFTGNILMKTAEGYGGFINKSLKKIFLKNIVTKMSALIIKSGFTEFKKTMDYTEYGGAPLAGISKPVIKAHGSSNAKAIENAIYQAKKCVESNMIEELTRYFEKDSVNPE